MGRGLALAGGLLLSASVIASMPGTARAEGGDALYFEVDALRRAEGLPPLARDVGLSEAARVQADDMARHGYLGHTSPRTGDPGVRARAAGVVAEALAENVMRAATELEAHRALEASEVHRVHLVSERFTHVGIAWARAEDGQTYLCELFAALPSDTSEPAAPPAPEPPAAYRTDGAPGPSPLVTTPALVTTPTPNPPAAPAPDTEVAPASPSVSSPAPVPPPGARPAPAPPTAGPAAGPTAGPAVAPPSAPPRAPRDPNQVTAIPTRNGYWLWWEGRWVWVSRGTATARPAPRRHPHRRTVIVR